MARQSRQSSLARCAPERAWHTIRGTCQRGRSRRSPTHPETSRCRWDPSGIANWRFKSAIQIGNHAGRDNCHPQVNSSDCLRCKCCRSCPWWTWRKSCQGWSGGPWPHQGPATTRPNSTRWWAPSSGWRCCSCCGHRHRRQPHLSRKSGTAEPRQRHRQPHTLAPPPHRFFSARTTTVETLEADRSFSEATIFADILWITMLAAPSLSKFAADTDSECYLFELGHELVDDVLFFGSERVPSCSLGCCTRYHCPTFPSSTLTWT